MIYESRHQQASDEVIFKKINIREEDEDVSEVEDMEDDLPETSTPNQHEDDNANMPRNMRDETMLCQYPPSRH